MSCCEAPWPSLGYLSQDVLSQNGYGPIQAAIREPIRVPKTDPGSPRGVFTLPGCFLGVRVCPTYQILARTLMAARAHRFLVSVLVFISHKV